MPTNRTNSPGRSPRSRRVMALLLLALIPTLTGCTTFKKDNQIEFDYYLTGYRIYIYNKPSYQLAVSLRDVCKHSKGTGREEWGRCSLTFLRSVKVDTIAKIDWNHFTEGGRWDDYTTAIADVNAGGTASPGGVTYTKRCLVGDHTVFSDYNWTFREGSDSHCHVGSQYKV